MMILEVWNVVDVLVLRSDQGDEELPNRKSTQVNMNKFRDHFDV